MSLIIKDLKKKFDSHEVLKGADFNFQKGKIYSILGRNGAGKTTLFNTIYGELKPDGGTVQLLKDEVVKKIDEKDISYVFSEPVLPEFLTGYEFIKFFVDVNKDNIEKVRSVEEYFNMIGFSDKDQHKLIKEYSLGMKNKISCLCFMIVEPYIILLDEPLTSLDIIAAMEMKSLLKEIKKDHIILITTHILEIATEISDEIVVLNEGKLTSLDMGKLEMGEFKEKLLTMLKGD